MEFHARVDTLISETCAMSRVSSDDNFPETNRNFISFWKSGATITSTSRPAAFQTAISREKG